MKLPLAIGLSHGGPTVCGRKVQSLNRTAKLDRFLVKRSGGGFCRLEGADVPVASVVVLAVLFYTSVGSPRKISIFVKKHSIFLDQSIPKILYSI